MSTKRIFRQRADRPFNERVSLLVRDTLQDAKIDHRECFVFCTMQDADPETVFKAANDAMGGELDANQVSVNDIAAFVFVLVNKSGVKGAGH